MAKTKRFELRLTDKQYAAIDGDAKEAGVSMAELILSRVFPGTAFTTVTGRITYGPADKVGKAQRKADAKGEK